MPEDFKEAEWWIQGTGQASEYAEVLIAELERLGLAYMEADYSGGNDEGGVTGVSAWTTPEPTPQDLSVDLDFAEQRTLWDAADGFIGTKYGSWAGDFEAYGQVKANVAERRVWSEGEESTYVSDSEPVEVQL